MAAWRDKAERILERHYPLAGGALSVALTLWFGPSFFKYAAKKQWHFDYFYAGLFTVSTVATAFLFAFYTFLSTSDRSFLKKARASIFYQSAVRYCMQAMALGLAMIVASLPMMFIQPAPMIRDGWLVAVSGWIGIAVWSLIAAERTTRLFTIFTMIEDRRS